MSRAKKWDVNWDAPSALVKFAELEEAEIAVALQIFNLIYTQNKRIKNEPENIAKYIKKMSAARCAKVINSLVDKGVVYKSEDGTLSSRKCDEVLNEREQSFNRYSGAGKASAEAKAKKKTGNQVNQGEDFNDVGNGVCESTSFLPSTSEESKLHLQSTATAKRSFKIMEALSEDGKQAARAAAPGWDIQRLAERFDAKIENGEFQRPTKPDDAFPAWLRVYTKGIRP